MTKPSIPTADCLKAQLDVLDAAIGALYEQRQRIADHYFAADAAARSRDAYRESLTDKLRDAAKQRPVEHYGAMADEAQQVTQ